jgi:hypothetical protein
LLVRYNADGSLDTGFGGTGFVITDFGSDDLAVGVALQSNGTIVVVGFSGSDFAVARYEGTTPEPTATPTPTATVTPTPTPTPAPQLTALGPAQIWIGLKNSDDVGTKFDLLAEVLKNGTVVGSGQVNSVSGGSSGFNNAVLDTINMALSGAVPINPGDTLSLRLSVRVASTGHRSGTARLWFNDAAANSRFSATIAGAPNSYFLRSGSTLTATAGSGPKSTIDVFVDRAVGGNPFKPFGTWSKLY